jgi:hypothetical protein
VSFRDAIFVAETLLAESLEYIVQVSITEFLPSRVDRRLEALLHFVLTNLDQIDERELSDPRLAQAVFLRAPLSNLLI